MSDQPTYQPGTIVNGHVWTGTDWLPIKQPPRPNVPASPWRVIAGIACLVGGAIAAFQTLAWLAGYTDLKEQGNDFAGLLALLTLGGGAVALAFLVVGITLLTKKS